jgi:hypothetical protein
MKLYRHPEVPDDEQAMLCRQSRLGGILRLIIWCGFLAVPLVFGWNSGNLWLFWIGIALAAVVIPIAMLDLAAMFRATNWLMRIGSDGVWINLRSYRDRSIDANALTVVRLDYGEIAGVGSHTESYTTPAKAASEGSTEWRDEFLAIELTHDETDELKAALNDLRFSPAAPSPGGEPHASGHVPTVWLVDSSTLRIVWTSSHGPVVAPRLTQVLSRLATYAQVAQFTRRERPNWRKLTPEEATELARELVHVHGETFASTSLLSRVCPISHSEASRQVQHFAEEVVV